MQKLGKQMQHWLGAALQWLGGKVWQLIVITFWLLIQVLELLVWAISELKARVTSAIITVKTAVRQKNFDILLWPLQAMLRVVWEILVRGFWLLIQTLELIIWYVQIVRRGDRTKR